MKLTLMFDFDLDGKLDADDIATAFLDAWVGSVLLPENDDDDWVITINSTTAKVDEETKEKAQP